MMHFLILQSAHRRYINLALYVLLPHMHYIKCLNITSHWIGLHRNIIHCIASQFIALTKKPDFDKKYVRDRVQNCVFGSSTHQWV